MGRFSMYSILELKEKRYFQKNDGDFSDPKAGFFPQNHLFLSSLNFSNDESLFGKRF